MSKLRVNLFSVSLDGCGRRSEPEPNSSKGSWCSPGLSDVLIILPDRSRLQDHSASRFRILPRRADGKAGRQ